ncbi:hypothetical protein [Thalassomonas actiniarum]|uniref:Tetratricopeptide repeat protein n=1 Tax=Thalassomonas actiniarum TaxID=485447 RepID=A0AAE9YSH6_9GAMM|nr:hypothetical protein [Thalassomonas actiniarum]WDE00261.1 hypothetical protein SG35_006305 [Thalassomonas actiniarum]
MKTETTYHKAAFTKSSFIKVTTATALLTVLLATSAFANTHAATEAAGFKIAVIDGSSGSARILSGEYQKGLEEITEDYRHNTNSSYAWEYELGLCVANLKMQRLTAAQTACSRAITTMPRHMKRSRKGRYLHSIALSNRGIVRYISADFSGALTDFNTAVTINKNLLVEQNLARLTNSLTINNTKAPADSFAATAYTKSRSE